MGKWLGKGGRSGGEQGSCTFSFSSTLRMSTMSCAAHASVLTCRMQE